MALAKAKARASKTFIVQASLMLVTYDRQNIFIVHATEREWGMKLSKKWHVYNIASLFVQRAAFFSHETCDGLVIFNHTQGLHYKTLEVVITSVS